MARDPYSPSGRRHNATMPEREQGYRIMDDVNYGDRRPSNGVLQWLEDELEKHEKGSPHPACSEELLRQWYSIRDYLTQNIARVKTELNTPQKG